MQTDRRDRAIVSIVTRAIHDAAEHGLGHPRDQIGKLRSARLQPSARFGRIHPADRGICNGVVTVDIISPELITGDDYIVSFVDSAGFAIAFNLQRVSKSTHDTTLVLDRQPFTDASGDNLSIVDGFRLTVKNAPFGVASLTWTK